MNDGENFLELTHVARTYRTGDTALEVLSDVNLSLPSGSWCCIYGASGSGKTTLLNLIGALERPDAGTIRVGGTELSSLDRRAAARFRARRIGFVFQSYHLLFELTIRENAALAGQLAGMNAFAARRRAGVLLEQVGLAGRMDHRPSELSGGEQQRAAVARALMNSPELILADEPTGNLDRHTGDGILELFGAIRRENSARTIVMITHNREIAKLADRVVELHEGKLD